MSQDGLVKQGPTDVVSTLPPELNGLSDENTAKVMRLLSKFAMNKVGFMTGTIKGSYRPSNIKICQPMTQNKPNNTIVGQLFTSDNKHLGDTIEVIPLNVYISRTKWPEGESTSEKPECNSQNNVVGHWQGMELRLCRGDESLGIDECPYFGYDDVQRKYLCKPSYNFVGITPDYSEFYVLQFGGMGYSVGDKFNAILNRNDVIFEKGYKFSAKKQVKSKTNAYEWSAPEEIITIEAETDDAKILSFFSSKLFTIATDRQNREVTLFYESYNASINSGQDSPSEDEPTPENEKPVEEVIAQAPVSMETQAKPKKTPKDLKM